jgi:hypothetical protein
MLRTGIRYPEIVHIESCPAIIWPGSYGILPGKHGRLKVRIEEESCAKGNMTS